MTNLVDIHQTEKFIIFLLNEIDRYKKDWYLSSSEAEGFKNEINNFKQKINDSFWVPAELKKDIMKLCFHFDEPKLTFKKFFKLMMFREYYDEVNNQKLQTKLDAVGDNLRAIQFKFKKYKIDNNME